MTFDLKSDHIDLFSLCLSVLVLIIIPLGFRWLTAERHCNIGLSVWFLDRLIKSLHSECLLLWFILPMYCSHSPTSSHCSLQLLYIMGGNERDRSRVMVILCNYWPVTSAGALWTRCFSSLKSLCQHVWLGPFHNCEGWWFHMQPAGAYIQSSCVCGLCYCVEVQGVADIHHNLSLYNNARAGTGSYNLITVLYDSNFPCLPSAQRNTPWIKMWSVYRSFWVCMKMLFSSVCGAWLQFHSDSIYWQAIEEKWYQSLC